ncbi:hypothetical protein RRG08_059529 [Elysia crispata]|uniref:Uncharacterized protein n=1 Tax=Elysia crispata TaxID=231223 RepID=A0AAE1DCQ9_9GAST|nr:hypothetical protein RRG08_059529 [Elysia crispata]
MARSRRLEDLQSCPSITGLLCQNLGESSTIEDYRVMSEPGEREGPQENYNQRQNPGEKANHRELQLMSEPGERKS